MSRTNQQASFYNDEFNAYALGITPLAIFLLSPPSAFLSGICIPMGIIGMLSPMPDYMDVHIICKQVPKGALVHTQNDGFYWYK